MRLLLQRVKHASVFIPKFETVESIQKGILLFAGFGAQDREELPECQVWTKMLNKVPEIRIFPDQEGKTNQNLFYIQGDLMIISQFTLYADCRKGKRPSYINAASPEIAEYLYKRLVRELREICPGKVASGVFGSEMEVSFCNWGPLSIILDSEDIV